MKPLPVRAQRGMTLVELMVALTIGLFLTMGMSAIIVAALRQQKISASVNERDMSAVSGCRSWTTTHAAQVQAFPAHGIWDFLAALCVLPRPIRR